MKIKTTTEKIPLNYCYYIRFKYQLCRLICMYDDDCGIYIKKMHKTGRKWMFFTEQMKQSSLIYASNV